MVAGADSLSTESDCICCVSQVDVSGRGAELDQRSWQFHWGTARCNLVRAEKADRLAADLHCVGSAENSGCCICWRLACKEPEQQQRGGQESELLHGCVADKPTGLNRCFPASGEIPSAMSSQNQAIWSANIQGEIQVRNNLEASLATKEGRILIPEFQGLACVCAYGVLSSWEQSVVGKAPGWPLCDADCWTNGPSLIGYSRPFVELVLHCWELQSPSSTSSCFLILTFYISWPLMMRTLQWEVWRSLSLLRQGTWDGFEFYVLQEEKRICCDFLSSVSTTGAPKHNLQASVCNKSICATIPWSLDSMTYFSSRLREVLQLSFQDTSKDTMHSVGCNANLNEPVKFCGWMCARTCVCMHTCSYAFI